MASAVGSTLNLLLFRKFRRLDVAVRIHLILSNICYGIGAVAVAGAESPSTIFTPLIVVLGGLLAGTRGVIFSALWLILEFLVAAAYHWSVNPTLVANDRNAFATVMIISCIASIAGVIWLYELMRKRAESSLIAMNASLKNEQAQNEQILRALDGTNHRLAAALESRAFVIWELDVESDVLHVSTVIDGNVVFVPVTHAAFVEQIVDEDRDAFERLFQENLKSHTKNGLEFRIRRDDGGVRWRHTGARKYVWEDGKLKRVIGSSLDISEVKEKEQEVADERLAKDALVTKVINGIPALISYWDGDTRNIFANERYSRRFARPASEIKGLFLQDLIGFDNFEQIKPAIASVLKGQKTSFERVMSIDGVERNIRLHLEPDFSLGAVNGYFLIGLDVTEEKQLQRELEFERVKSLRNAKLASLGEMCAGIAHEINNPLAIIAGTVRALPRFASDADQLKVRIETIESASQRIAKIVRSLRKFSRSDEKSQYFPHELSAVINEALVLTEAKSRRHSTPVSLDCRCKGHVLCDEIEIEQVMVNLINNAIDAVKSRPEKCVRIELFDEGPSMILRVRDSGPGISAEVKLKLFQPFFTTKPVGQGTGLGLSIVKGILDEHQATIDVMVHEPNTCFEIRFPKAEAKKDAA